MSSDILTSWQTCAVRRGQGDSCWLLYEGPWTPLTLFPRQGGGRRVIWSRDERGPQRPSVGRLGWQPGDSLWSPWPGPTHPSNAAYNIQIYTEDQYTHSLLYEKKKVKARFLIHTVQNARIQWTVFDIWGPIHEANIQQFLSFDSCKTKLQCILEKNALKKYDLQESYNNFNIKLKISFCESDPRILKSRI